jgi:hypothetical protein
LPIKRNRTIWRERLSHNSAGASHKKQLGIGPEMDSNRLFYRLFAVVDGAAPAFIGNAFPIAPNGHFLTCRHVVQAVPDGGRLALFNNLTQSLVEIAAPARFPSNAVVDLALISVPLQNETYLPILAPLTLRVGEDAFTYGYFAIGGDSNQIENGYFAGKIVNFFNANNASTASLTLPFASIEGMSGSPVLTYHNGVKLIGMIIGNRSSRILASEVQSYQDDKVEFRETINRIIEFGIAYHPAAIVNFLAEVGLTGHVITDSRVQLPGIED